MIDMEEIRALWLLTFRQPRDAARVILQWDLPAQVWWLAAATVAVLSALISLTGEAIMPASEDELSILIWVSPIGFAILSFVALVVTSAVFSQTGRVLGGTGRFRQIFALMVWLQAALLVIEIALMVLILLTPVLAGLIAIGVYMVAFVWLVLFLQIGHGFTGAGRAVATLILSMFLIGFLFQFLMIAGGRP